MGPSFENFREIVAMMQARGAIHVLAPRESLAAALTGALSGSPETRALGHRGRETFLSQSGATGRCLNALTPLIAASEHAA